MKRFLFTYGTLSNHAPPREVLPVLKKLKYVGDGFVYGRLYNLDDFPGIILSKSFRNKVYGRVFELPDDPTILRRIDEYEEFFANRKSKSLFLRKQVPVKLSDGDQIKCWIYVYNKEVTPSKLIPSGDYAQIAA